LARFQDSFSTNPFHIGCDEKVKGQVIMLPLLIKIRQTAE